MKLKIPATTLAILALASPAQAETIQASLVCAVKEQVRAGGPGWNAEKCQRVAGALNATGRPHLYGAIMVNESDMRETVWAEVRPGVFDVGPMGVRCVTDGAHAREGKRQASVTARPHTKPQPPRGRCTNGPARGYSIRQLMDPVISVWVAAQIMASKPNTGNYNARDPELARRYADKIAILSSALAGRPINPKRLQRKRLRKLVQQIQVARWLVSRS